MCLGIVEKNSPEMTENELHEREAYFQDLFNTRTREGGYNKTDPRKEPMRSGPRKSLTPIKHYQTRSKASPIAIDNLSANSFEKI